MGVTNSQINNFENIKENTYEELWNSFVKESPYISEKQLELFKNIIPDKTERLEIIKKEFNISNEKKLKHYMLVNLLNKYYKINNTERELLKFFFNKNLHNKIVELLPEYENINNDEELLYKLTKIDLKKIYKHYPKLNYSKAINLFKSDDYPLNYDINLEAGYQYRFKDNHLTEEKLYYVKFYDWCTIDIDNKSEEEVLKSINDLIEKNSDLLLALYQTNKGYHIHIMSDLIKYNDKKYKELSLLLDNDPLYYSFVINNGYKLRISKKEKEDTYISLFKGYYGNKKSFKEKCGGYQVAYENYKYKFLSDEELEKIKELEKDYKMVKAGRL